MQTYEKANKGKDLGWLSGPFSIIIATLIYTSERLHM